MSSRFRKAPKSAKTTRIRPLKWTASLYQLTDVDCPAEAFWNCTLCCCHLTCVVFDLLAYLPNLGWTPLAFLFLRFFPVAGTAVE